MMLKKRLQRHGARLLSSHTLKNLKRRGWQVRQALTAGQPEVEVWLRANDPYCYLLVQILPSLQQRFAVNWRFRVIASLQDAMYPEPEMWQNNAVLDSGYLAELYGLTSPALEAPSIAQVEVATARLLELQRKPLDWQQVIAVYDDLWLGNLRASICLTNAQKQLLADNEQLLQKKGHYLSATLNFQGEWYWGLDRMDHLERRLNSLKLNTATAKVIFNKTYVDFCRPYDAKHVDYEQKKQPLILYFSIRSPYSHLGLERAVTLARHYDIPVIVKPVLPMMMRGLNVPPTKKFYIFSDTKREADKFGIDYGFVADPLGLGVERCYALFEYARQLGKEVDYLLSYARGVNAEGILSETDAGLKMIVERAGLEWSAAQAILTKPGWRTDWHKWANDHREEMIQQGQWGVPSLRYHNLTLWGQDRIEFIEQAIRHALLGPEQ